MLEIVGLLLFIMCGQHKRSAAKQKVWLRPCQRFVKKYEYISRIKMAVEDRHHTRIC